MLFLDSNSLAAVGDTTRILTFISGYYRSLGILENVDIDANALFSTVEAMHRDFPYPGGAGGASPFKKIAQFVCYFVATCPIKTPLPKKLLDSAEEHEQIGRTNAVVALMIAIESLNGATLTWEDSSQHVLKEKIYLSSHSFIDITDALTNATPSTAFKLVRVLFEQMAYKTNPDCQYPVDI